MSTAKQGERFVLSIDWETMNVVGWPKPRRIGKTIVAISGFVSPNEVNSGTAHDIVHQAYVKQGPELSRQLLGQYCAVVVDFEKESACLIQDSLGLRDLFYVQSEHGLAIASDLDLVLAVTDDLEISEEYFASFIGLPAVDHKITPFRNVQRLAHGWTLQMSDNQGSRHQPWKPPEKAAEKTGRNLAEQLRCLLDEAVRSTLPHEGTVLCELTGGLDSTSVFTTARQHYTDIQAVTYVSERGVIGDDELFAGEVISSCPARWHRVSIDTDEILPETYGRFVPEPSALLYAHQFADIKKCLSKADAKVLLSGALGDIIFEFGGITPAFLADPIYKGAIFKAIGLAREWADARENNRPWSHYLTHIGLPLALRHFRHRSLLDWEKIVLPKWISPGLASKHGLNGLELPVNSPRIAEPGPQHLWESVYDLAAQENSTMFLEYSADVRHPLYFRPLVEFLLGLDFRDRRGISGDRQLQRQALSDRLPEVVLNRRSKGSAQELRERHLVESRRWYEAMTVNPRIVERGWVDFQPWKEEVDRARVGASSYSTEFVNAIQTELWLRALEQYPRPSQVNLV